MTGIPRPTKRCGHPGCRANATRGRYCSDHHAVAQAHRFNTPAKRDNPKVYHSKEYHRERAAVKRDRGSCHLSHISACNGPLHYHSTRPPSHAREDCAFLCQRHHMQLEQQGKQGPHAQALRITLDAILGA